MNSQKDLDKGKYWSKALQLTDGCTKCSTGCLNCWSEALAKRFHQAETYNWHGDIRVNYDKLDLPLKIKKPTVFAIWNDLFHKKVDTHFKVLAFNTMSPSIGHTFLVLTKRIKAALKFSRIYPIEKIDNLWLGTTVCNQKEADEKIPVLLQIPAAHRWLSLEPILEQIDITKYLWVDRYEDNNLEEYGNLIQQVVVGCESGPGHRPCNLEWIESIVKQCREAKVPCFVKQININGKVSHNTSEWPDFLRVRELAWK